MKKIDKKTQKETHREIIKPDVFLFLLKIAKFCKLCGK